MDFARTPEQAELATMLEQLLARRSDPRAAIAAEAGYDTALWATLCEQVGVAALPIPERYDGAGASYVETAVALEELAYALTPSPLLAGAIATAWLLTEGAEEQRTALLPRIAAGEVATLLGTPTLEPGAGVVVPQEAALTPQPAMDLLLRLARETGPAWSPEVGAVAAALATAEQLGTARRGLAMTVAYSLERTQFGRPIGSFQALKHRMADLLVLVEAMTSASWAATAAVAGYVERPDQDRRTTLRRRAAVAKAYCSEALRRIAGETVQLHGGIAITWEHDAHLVLKRAHSLGELFGTAAAHRRTLEE